MASRRLVLDGLGKSICRSKEGAEGRHRWAESEESKGTEEEVQLGSCVQLNPYLYHLRTFLPNAFR